jgi:hypothetical protein
MASDNVLDQAALESVAEQMMRGAEVVVEERSFRVTRTGGKLAQEGHRVVQFRDLETQKYRSRWNEKMKEYGR